MSCEGMALTAVTTAVPGQQEDGQRAGQLHGQQQQHVPATEVAQRHSVQQQQQQLQRRQQVGQVCASLFCGTRSLLS
jgi:hypothetical protein